MAVTDLLAQIPNPLADRREDPAPVASSGDGETRPFALELPGYRSAPPAPPLEEEDATDTDALTWSASALPYLPSHAVVLIGGLALACLALTVALLAALTAAPTPDAAPVQIAPPVETASADAAPDPTPLAATPASFPAEPASIPIELITELEASSDQPLEVELARLLDAIQHGFGTGSVRLEPTLRSYVYRMSSRFEWNPDSYRVAVTAPSDALADARGALLRDLFADAVASGRLQISAGTGPHALTLVTE